ncbi:unnamed protein product [Soboliphyme baturini]|uniref:ShKT domain-containing protein n=1 Tax=Soboliphyme baturini TaxID=241478 RepID=A0A183J7B4_9BILA|nr:unnamed protein product [Soboliphyme baturini]
MVMNNKMQQLVTEQITANGDDSDIVTETVILELQDVDLHKNGVKSGANVQTIPSYTSAPTMTTRRMKGHHGGAKEKTGTSTLKKEATSVPPESVDKQNMLQVMAILFEKKNMEVNGTVLGLTTLAPGAWKPDDGQCSDHFRLCKEWAKHGECVSNPYWMKPNCKMSCNACQEVVKTTTPSNSDCIDRDENCEFWASFGECIKNYKYMSSHCPVACGTCP